MSISDFEDRALTYVWRGLVLAGVLTVLAGIFVPASNVPQPIQGQRQAPGATNTASRTHGGPANADEAR